MCKSSDGIAVSDFDDFFKKSFEKPSDTSTTGRGWICPKCGKANAPWKASCDCVSIPYNLYPVPYYGPRSWWDSGFIITCGL